MTTWRSQASASTGAKSRSPSLLVVKSDACVRPDDPLFPELFVTPFEGGLPTHIATADLDLDGDPDIVVADLFSIARFENRLTQAEADLLERPRLFPPVRVDALAIADVGPSVPRRIDPTGALVPEALTDGFPDLLVAGEDESEKQPKLLVYQNVADGTLEVHAPKDLNLREEGQEGPGLLTDLAVGDFNDDGIPDIAITDAIHDELIVVKTRPPPCGTYI